MKNFRGFFSGVLVTLLAVVLIGGATATVGKRIIEVDYSDISIYLNGTTLKLTDVNGKTVEPFTCDGTTYVPVRAIASALGADVQWYKSENSSSQGVGLLTGRSALSPEYPFSGVPRFDNIVGQNAFTMSFPAKKGSTERTFYQYYKPYFKAGTEDSYVSLYEDALDYRGFHLFQTSTVDGYPMYHYVNDDTKVFVSLSTSKLDGQEYIAILVNTEQQKRSSSASGSKSTGSGSSSSSGGGTVAPSPSPSPTESDSPKFDGMCPVCGIACTRDYLNGTYEVWKCRNPKCTHYDQIVYP